MSVAVEDFTIRAGAFHGPALLLSSGSRQFQTTIQDLGLPTDPEEIVDVSAYLKGMTSLTRLADNSDFFVWAGYSQRVEDLGFFGRAIISAETLWDALQIARSALLYYQSDSELVIRVYNGRCHIWYFNPFNPRQAVHDVQYTMSLLANVICLSRFQSDPDILIAYPNGSPSHFPYTAPIAQVRNSSQGYISFDDKLLKSRMSGTDRLQAEVLSRYLADQSLMVEEKPNLKDLVGGLVRASFGVAPWSLVNTSQALEIHERTLQLRLKSEGTSFREIVKSERHRMSKRLLIAGKSIDETAEILGFDHRQSFSAAFSSWEGMSPSMFANPHEPQDTNSASR